MKFAFFGTAEFSVLILEILKKNNYEPSFITTTPDKPAGRGLKPKSPPVKLWAEKNNIKYVQPASLKNRIEHGSIQAEIGIVASYGKIIPKEIIATFPKGILNVHPSLLPRWRGADPMRAAILAGDEKTGVTIILVDEQMDHGPILGARDWELEAGVTYEKLEKELAEIGGKLLAETIPKWLAGKIKPQEQEHEKATYTKKISKDDGHIDWHESAEIIERKIRALNPWPGTYTFWNEKRIKILEAKIYGEQPNHEHLENYIGVIFKENGNIFIPCSLGHIEPLKLQLEGKKPQTVDEFLNGHPDFVGAKLN